MLLEAITLPGRWIRLEPLALEHALALHQAAADGDLWRLRVTIIPHTLADTERYVQEALERRDLGREIPFAIHHLASGRYVGATRFRHIEPAHRRLEIGPTFIAQSFQRTSVNTEAKYLMLRHAFEHMGCIRVEMIADVLNEKSRAALLRIGAKEEGVMRQHLIMPDGRLRDSVLFSILDKEWPAVKTSLENRLGI